MSRTTTALKRLGVPGIAAVTMVAGLPLFLGTASAAHIAGIDLQKATGEDAAGVCLPYTVQIDFSDDNVRTANVIDVTLTDAGTDAENAAQDVDFCTAPFGVFQPATPADQQDGGAAGTDRAEFTTDANGFVTFGIVSTVAGGDVDIRAFYETTDNDVFNAGEFTDTERQTFGAGGAAGSNANADAARDVEVISNTASDTATVTTSTSDDTDNVVEGEARTFRVVVLNADGDRLSGVQVNYTLTTGGDAADTGSTVFSTTDNEGIATGTITFPARTSTNNADTTDTLTFFVNQSGGATAGRDQIVTVGGGDTAGEPQDTVAVTVRDAAGQANRTVSLTPESPVQRANDKDAVFTATVTDPRTTGAATTTEGTLIAFTVTGGSGDETVVVSSAQRNSDFANECSTDATASTTDGNASFCEITVTDNTPTVGQTLTVVATVRGTNSTDTATLTFRNDVSDARFVELTPPTVTVAPNTAQQLRARVTDVDGNPVRDVEVVFTETGAGAFRNGSSRVAVDTDENGFATIETLSLPGETGTQTVTATISDATTQCENAANVGTDPQGNQLNGTNNTGAAGVCADSSTVTFAQPAPSPSATNTATTPPTTTPPTSGTPANCTQTPTVVLERSTIIATGRVNYRVTGAPANSQVQIFAYSRPSTTYVKVRDVTIGADGNGPGGDGFTPPTNTRLYAQVVGCDTDESRFSVVINVRTQISLNVVRNGTKNYTFSGRLLPARPGGLIASLYRVTNDGRQILTAQTRANASDGRYVINRRFTGTGRFGFVVRTGQDLQNAPGSSNVRSLLVF